jgi:hypothetical protein
MPGQKRLLGRIAGTFFTCIFPGNIAQYKHRRNAFGLDADQKRFARLFFQPVLIAWALWSTDAIRSLHNTQKGSAKGASTSRSRQKTTPSKDGEDRSSMNL